VASVTSLQPRYSLVHREVEDQILPYCSREDIGVIVYSPMASGLLTGAMTSERAAKLSKDDWRRTHPDFTEPNLSRSLALVNACASLRDATTDPLGKSQLPGRYTMTPLQEPSLAPAMHSRRKE
jgi:aryl-alcohol dehydrogenase-like predicted oxidoreductase